MKKQTALQSLKNMILANPCECIGLKQYGVQVYNVNELKEYCNIVKVERVNGRYYMYDVNGNKYLISRQNNAEWFAAEFIELVNMETEIVKSYVETFNRIGKVTINEAFYVRFTAALDAIGAQYAQIAGTLGHCNQGYVVCSYEAIGDTVATVENGKRWRERMHDKNTATAQCFGVALEVVECLRDVETLTEEEAAQYYTSALLAKAQELAHREQDEPKQETATEAPNGSEQSNTPQEEEKTATEAENEPQGARLVDSLTYTSDGTAYTLNYYEGGTIERADTGQRQPITAEEWATLCHVLRDILGAA